MSGHDVAAQFLLALLDGSGFANALRRNGTPCRIRWPDDPKARHALVDAHLRGAPATLTFHATNREPWLERVDAVVLAAFCPAGDGCCRWLGIDLDAADHGPKGLADPAHAVQVIAERAANAGLLSGLLVARSRRGLGRHVFLMLPEPTELADAVIAVAALAASAFRVASDDVLQCEDAHAFRLANGGISRLGNAGSVEHLPRSSAKPDYGWPITLPCAGAFAAAGGGRILDPFTDQPVALENLPCCNTIAWTTFIAESKASLERHRRSTIPARRPTRRLQTYRSRPSGPIDRIHPETEAFKRGLVAEGSRNDSAFAAAANLLACGVHEREAEQLILAGATVCGFPEREARACFRSAQKAIGRRSPR